MWTATSENEHLSDKFTEGRLFLDFILLLKIFSILNFTMTECFFSFKHDIFIIKKLFYSIVFTVHIKWVAIISSLLRLLLKVWI